jgi:rod shape-determining protein MreC
MATSRDDFVIAIRSAFLKKGNKQRFSLIGLIFFSIGLLTLNKINFPLNNYLNIALNELVYRSSFIVSIPENKFQDLKNRIKDHYNVYSDYLEVKKELNTLKSEKYETKFLKAENERLKKTIDEYIYNSDELIAKVLIDKKSPFLKSIIVNKGSKDNVKLGMAVLDESYLVGKIVEVNYFTARALLISDLNSKIPVGIEPGNIQSILSGTGKQNGKIEYLETEVEIDDKSVVYTSGSGGIFKSGIPIGIYNKENKNLKEEEKIIFFSKLSQLTFVKLVEFEEVKN